MSKLRLYRNRDDVPDTTSLNQKYADAIHAVQEAQRLLSVLSSDYTEQSSVLVDEIDRLSAKLDTLSNGVASSGDTWGDAV